MSANGFWEWMERAPQSAARFSWNRRLGTNFERVAAVMLRQTDREAQWVPCPNQCCGGHRLVRSPSDGGGFLGVCDDDDPPCEDLSMTSDEARVWEMDYARLGRTVARALGCDARDMEMGSARCRQIGTFSGAGIPVVMLLPTSVAEFRECVNWVFLQLREHFILLAPTGRFMEASCHGLIKTAKAGLFDLGSLLALEADGRLRPLRNAAALFTPLVPKSDEPVTESEAMRVFSLMRALDDGGRKRKAPLSRVFQLLVLDGLSQEAVARECECVPSLVTLRVGEIEARMKRPVAELRALASRLSELNNVPSDTRARSIYRRGLTDDADEDE